MLRRLNRRAARRLKSATGDCLGWVSRLAIPSSESPAHDSQVTGTKMPRYCLGAADPAVTGANLLQSPYESSTSLSSRLCFGDVVVRHCTFSIQTTSSRNKANLRLARMKVLCEVCGRSATRHSFIDHRARSLGLGFANHGCAAHVGNTTAADWYCCTAPPASTR